ncbi:DUF4097 family beta strand repeat-containing protein [Sphingobacterium wenxiniae]|uniref:Adhesin domain-containing protein n=1 Tax=Sphingobacterium wenxiniae TaxID=683125 RepID=A0A1I6V9V6_9SPHI|nr:hypothetical protein [Sphingobacterium wenxiniae]SFT10548.1 hypothetical protein SAMN05660206_11233 [Sphingobacterium wenxiniae]
MKKKFVIMMSLLSFALYGVAQTNDDIQNEQVKTYKLAKRTGKLEVDLAGVVIEGYSGNEIVFSSLGKPGGEDERAKGLRAINGLGVVDNTGLGINVSEENGAVKVTQLNSASALNMKILVPHGMAIAFDHQSHFGGGGKTVFRNIQSEVEVSTKFNNIELENITGPATIKTVHGSVDAVFSGNVKGPISIVSIHGAVDVTVPQNIHADLKMNTRHGELLVAPELNINIQQEGEMIRYSNQVVGKINNGGTPLDLRSDHDRIYLRTK